MKFMVLILGIAMTLLAQTSLDIAKKSFEMISGYESSVSKTTMILKNANSEENVRKIEIKKLEGENGDKSLITFLYPMDIKGTKLLSFEIIGGDDKQWLYMPALKRVKRISSSNKSGSFMASEFSYEDIASQNYKNYNYEGEASKVVLDGVECFQIIRVPKDENSGYSKQIVYIDTKEYLPRFGKYYDKQGRLLKKIYFSKYGKIGSVYRIQKIKMENVQSKKSSLLQWDEDKIKTSFSKREFSKRALK